MGMMLVYSSMLMLVAAIVSQYDLCAQPLSGRPAGVLIVLPDIAYMGELCMITHLLFSRCCKAYMQIINPLLICDHQVFSSIKISLMWHFYIFVMIYYISCHMIFCNKL